MSLMFLLYFKYCLTFKLIYFTSFSYAVGDVAEWRNVGIMTFSELKLTLERWRKGELDVGRNDTKGGGIPVLFFIHHGQ